jgi:G patch domain and KOW motifs-containing protein
MKRDLCNVKLDDGTLLEGLKDTQLETALPKPGGVVVVLRGVGQGRQAKLLDRNDSKGAAVLQSFGDLEVMEKKMDDIAEWMGPIEEDEFAY